MPKAGGQPDPRPGTSSYGNTARRSCYWAWLAIDPGQPGHHWLLIRVQALAVAAGGTRAALTRKRHSVQQRNLPGAVNNLLTAKRRDARRGTMPLEVNLTGLKSFDV